MKPIEAIMRTAPVIPVLVIDDVGHALPVARALVAGGLRVLEVTLRTPAALEAITAMKSVEGAIVETRPVDLEADLRPMAHRYFGAELGDAYVGGGSGEGDLVFTMQPERWRTVDYRKMGAS